MIVITRNTAWKLPKDWKYIECAQAWFGKEQRSVYLSPDGKRFLSPLAAQQYIARGGKLEGKNGCPKFVNRMKKKMSGRKSKLAAKKAAPARPKLKRTLYRKVLTEALRNRLA